MTLAELVADVAARHAGGALHYCVPSGMVEDCPESRLAALLTPESVAAGLHREGFETGLDDCYQTDGMCAHHFDTAVALLAAITEDDR